MSGINTGTTFVPDRNAGDSAEQRIPNVPNSREQIGGEWGMIAQHATRCDFIE